ncbi:prepilin-type N-terminal cleavage/methylation domain-containing protein [bacterium]|nr:prepilin-type N-terminal cleavage/methylation domain-containing protein [bacterium]
MFSKSFTLIEILVVVAIIAIIAGISFLAIVKIQPSLYLKSAVREIVNDMRWAQQSSITQQLNFGILFSTTSQSYKIVKYVTPTSTKELMHKSLRNGISFKEINGFTNNEVIYNPYGAVEEDGIISLSNINGKIITIQVRPSGFIRTLE